METKEIQKLREDYTRNSLDKSDVLQNPVDQFKLWLNEAINAKLPEPNAMSLATVDAENKPHNRVVLLKGIENGNFVFYTNYESDKGHEIAQNNNISICFLWKELERQVRIDGIATKLNRENSEEYFKSRPVKSQIGALASNQSSILTNRKELEEKFYELDQQFEHGNVPMPEYWGGYEVKPEAIEFWQGRRSRLHDRIKFTKEGKSWKINRLAP